MGRPYMSLDGAPDAFWSKVNKTEKCWLWNGPINADGYGIFNYSSLVYKAHAYSLKLVGIKIPRGWTPHHRCEVKICVNPDHIEIMTRAEHARLHDHSCSPDCECGRHGEAARERMLYARQFRY